MALRTRLTVVFGASLPGVASAGLSLPSAGATFVAPAGPRRDARPGERTDRPAPRTARPAARGPVGGTNTAPADGSDKPAEATPGSEAPKTTVKRVRKATPAAAADGAKTE